MMEVDVIITKEQYELAKAKSPYAIISDSITMGYGCYGAQVYEEKGKYHLKYSRGDNCD